MKLSLIKKMALLLVGLATVQGYASNDDYVYNRLIDVPSIGTNALTKVGGLIGVTDQTINGFNVEKTDLSFTFYSFYGRDGASFDRRIIFHGFGISDEYDYYGFWGKYKPKVGALSPYEAYYGYCDASLQNNCESTFIKDLVVEFSGAKRNTQELNLSEFLSSLIASGRQSGYKKIRIAVADLQYWSLDNGDWTTEPNIADEKSISDHPTYTYFIDVDIPFVEASIKPERGSGYTICDDSPSHCASNNIVDAIGGSVKIRVAYTAISDFSYKVVNASDMEEPLVSGDVKGDGPLSNEMVLTIPINRKPGENVYSFKFCTAPYGTSEYSCTDGNVGVFVKNGFEMKPERGFGYTICEDSPSHCASNNIVDVIGNSVKTRVLYSTTSSFSYKVVNTSDMDDALVSGDVEGDGLLSNEMVLTIPIDRKSGKDSYTFKFCTASLGSSEYSCLPGSVSAFVKYGAEMKPERGYGYTICEDSPTNCATNNVVDVDGDNIKVRAVYSFLSGFSYKIVNTSEMDKTLVSGEVEENDALSGEIVLSIPVERKVGVTYYGFKLCTAPINSLDYTCEGEVVGAFLKYTPFAVTFLDFDGKKLLTTVAEAGDDLVDRAPEVKTKDDTEKFHYFVKWMQISQEDAGEVTYKATLDSVLNNLELTFSLVDPYVGSKPKTSISPSTACIEMIFVQLEDIANKRKLDKEGSYNYIDDIDKFFDYTFEFWRDGRSYPLYRLHTEYTLIEDGDCADDMVAKTIRYYVDKDGYWGDGRMVDEYSSTMDFYESYDGKIYSFPSFEFDPTFGAVVFKQNYKATIDGTSKQPVVEQFEGYTATSVRLDRKVAKGAFSTIMLPFSVDTKTFSDATFYSFAGVDLEKNEVQFSEVSKVEANTPYIMVAAYDGEYMDFGDGDNMVRFTTEGPKSSTAGNWQFVGTYEYKKWTEGDPELGRAFVIDEMGKLKKIKVGDEQYPLSAYLVDLNARVVTFFDDKGVQVGDVVTVASGMAVGAPAEPAKREGYTFAGWFQKDAETAYDFSAAVNEDLELYGKWTINKYEIAVAANDSKMGSVKGAGTYEYGTEVELVATAAEGYKFSNWEDDVKASATRKVKVTAAASYKANFEKIPESSASAEKTSSSSTKPKSSSSSTKPKSSSSKTDAIVAAAAVPQFSLSVAGRNVQIAGARVGSAYAILDMQGRVLATGRTASASMEIAVPRAGSYMVRVGSQTKRVNVK